jgi:polygalacturonase
VKHYFPIAISFCFCAFSVSLFGQENQSRIIDAASFGVVADDGKSDTIALQNAIDSAHRSGGGRVVLPEGVTLSGTMHLRSNVTLEVPSKAILRASTDRTEFTKGAWLLAESCTNVSIRGPGKLLGNGSQYFDVQFAKIAQWMHKGAPAGLLEHPVSVRPLCFHFMLQFVECTHVSVERIQILDSQHWTVHFLACDNVVCEHVQIKNSVYGPYTDGFDIDGSNDVEIRDCDVTAGDDAFCIKNTNKRGLARECANITLNNCTARSPTNGFKIGTETHASISNVTFRHCEVAPPIPGVLTLGGVTITTVDGGSLHNIDVSDIRMTAVRCPVFIRLGNRTAASKADAKPGELARVRIRDIVVDLCTAPITISGIHGHLIRDIELDRVILAQRIGAVDSRLPHQVPENATAYPESTMFGPLPATALFARYVDGLVLKDVCLVTSVDGSVGPTTAIHELSHFTGAVELFDSVNDLPKSQRTKHWHRAPEQSGPPAAPPRTTAQ